MSLPLGFKFDPTDQLVLVDYLTKKISGEQLPCDHSSTTEVYATEPWNLIPAGETSACYFSPIARHGNSKRASRRAGGGTWKANGKTFIMNAGGKVVAHKQLLTFHATDSNKSSRYVMQEYQLAQGSTDLVFCWIKVNAHMEKQLKRISDSDPQEFMFPPSRRQRVASDEDMNEPAKPVIAQPILEQSDAAVISCDVNVDKCKELVWQKPAASTPSWSDQMNFMCPLLEQQTQHGVIREEQKEHVLRTIYDWFVEKHSGHHQLMQSSSPCSAEQQLEEVTLRSTPQSMPLPSPGITEPQRAEPAAVVVGNSDEPGAPKEEEDYDWLSSLLETEDEIYF